MLAVHGGASMGELIRLDDNWARDDLSDAEINEGLGNSVSQLQLLVDRKGAGSDFTGWLDLPVSTTTQLLERIEEAATSLRHSSDVVIICGIGGSYLGARAGLAFLSTASERQPDILFAGNSLSPIQLQSLMTQIANRRFSIIVISKSGTTLETAVAFHMLRAELERRFGTVEARSRIVAVTDPSGGILRDLANDQGFTVFDLPGDVGGRYSVLSAVGLLPFAVRGLDIRAILRGAAKQREASLSAPFETNGALRYAVLRRLLNKKGRSVELFASFEPAFHYVGEWWKQLFGESEGKDAKGIFPSSADYTTDLHSLGQFVQEGTHCLFETVFDAMIPVDLAFSCSPDSPDGLGYLSGQTLSQMNQNAKAGTMLAHRDGGVPVLQISVPDFSEQSFGAMVYFLEIACAVGGYLLGINPFDQPGVEAYKRNMFALLGKPGTEDTAAYIRSRLVHGD